MLFADVVRSMDCRRDRDAERLARNHGRSVRSLCGGGDATAGRSTSSPATASWRCSARRPPWRTTLFAPAWRRWRSRSTPSRRRDEARRHRVADANRPELGPGHRRRNRLSRKASYTAIGEQVGMAQRMESVAPPGGVMLSESTARLVEHAVVLGDLELRHIKGADEPGPRDGDCWRSGNISHAAARNRLWSDAPGNSTPSPRSWTRPVGGAGCVVTVVGPPASARAG